AAAPPSGPGDALERVSTGQAMAVGGAQALALIPGTSRSGITITAGLLGGIDRATAARLAFLLGIPVTARAGSLKALHLGKGGIPPGEGGPLAAALVTAFVSGWFAVWFLVSYLKTRSLRPFVVYRLLLALVIFLVVLRGRRAGYPSPGPTEVRPTSDRTGGRHWSRAGTSRPRPAGA